MEKMVITIPEINSKDQERVIEWAKALNEKHISISTIIEYLVSDKKTQSEYLNEGLDEVRAIYNRYNNSWRGELLTAILVKTYRYENDVTEGEIATNGEVVGYVGGIDYQKRVIELYSAYNRVGFIGKYNMSDFRSVN